MIDLGYELGSGARVKIPLNHMAILGQTQLSGKTTTMEAVALRAGVRAISFITKPGEKSFRQRMMIPAFFSESTQEEFWKHVVSMLEYRSEVKLGWRERGVVIELCQDYKKEGSRIGMPDAKGKSKRERLKYSWKAPKTLAEFLANVNGYQEYARGSEEMICIQLREFLKPVISEIEKTELSDGLKALVIRSVIEWVHKHGRKIVVIIPEAWKFIPEGRSTPVKLALEGLIREGAGVGNFVWMDSQDLRGVDKKLLRSVIVWLFGVQRQRNEVANTLDSIPDHPKPSATEIMQLGKGEFYVCYGTTLVRTYVQPAGMEDAHAQAIARGEERPESWTQIVRSLDEEDSPRETRVTHDNEEPIGSADEQRGAAQPEQQSASRSSVAESDAARLEENRDPEDAMWKEKHEQFLKEVHQPLVEAHDALVERVRKLEGMSPSKSSLTEPVAGYQGQSRGKPAEAPTLNSASAAAFSNGHLDTVWNYIVARAGNEKPPALLKLLMQHPELTINVERKVIDIDYETVPGAIAKLIADKYFDQPHNGYQTFLELQRRGRKCAKV